MRYVLPTEDQEISPTMVVDIDGRAEIHITRGNDERELAHIVASRDGRVVMTVTILAERPEIPRVSEAEV